MKQNYFIVKTGWESFDLLRAYGLALILERLKSTEESVILKDMGFYYQIETPRVKESSKQEVAGLISSEFSPEEKRGFLEIERGWRYVLKTYKSDKNKKLAEYKKHLRKNLIQIIKKFSTIQNKSEAKKKIRDTLYGTIDPAAFKGTRVIKRNISYTEGSSYKIELDDIILASIGAAHLCIQCEGEGETLVIVGKPGNKGIPIENWRQIKNNISDQIKFHRAGALATICWTAVCLMREIKKFEDEKIFILFDDLHFNVLKKTGNQPKPEKGGNFSLEFLSNLSTRMEKDDFVELMEIWNKIFKVSDSKGLENLAIALAEFILNPTLTTFEFYLKTHLNLYLKNEENKKKVYILYNQNLMKKISKYVPTN